MESDGRGVPQLRVPQQSLGPALPGQQRAAAPWRAPETPPAALPRQHPGAEPSPEGSREVQRGHALLPRHPLPALPEALPLQRLPGALHLQAAGWHLPPESRLQAEGWVPPKHLEPGEVQGPAQPGATRLDVKLGRLSCSWRPAHFEFHIKSLMTQLKMFLSLHFLCCWFLIPALDFVGLIPGFLRAASESTE